jgi:hypothetical protein
MTVGTQQSHVAYPSFVSRLHGGNRNCVVTFDEGFSKFAILFYEAKIAHLATWGIHAGAMGFRRDLYEIRHLACQ